MLNLNSFLLFSENPSKLADFYKKILQKEPEWSEGGYSGFQVGDMVMMIGPHDKVKGKNTNPERFIFNFATDEVEKEFERMIKLGAKEVAAPYHPQEEEKMTIATLSDPDGNYFQLNTPMK